MRRRAERREAELLAAALHVEDAPRGPGTVDELVRLGAEVASVLDGMSLDPDRGRQLYARAVRLAGSRPPGAPRAPRLSRLPHPGRRAAAVLGGAAVISAAAVGLALARRLHGAAAG